MDYWNPDQTHKGPKKVKVQTPVYKTPVFIKENSNHKILDLNKLYKESLQIAKEKELKADGSELSIKEYKKGKN